MDHLRNLWAFAAVARAGSFTKAAETLGLSTVALSRSVARLEQGLQVKLFIRTTRQVMLTDEGRRLFDRIDAPFAAVADAVAGVQESSGRVTGTVRVSSVTAFGRRQVLPILGRFFERHPDVDVVLNLHDGSPGRSRQSYDIRINWGEKPEQDKVARTLTQIPLCVVASPHYLARHGQPAVPQDLARHACITAGFEGGVLGRWIFHGRNGEAAGEEPVVIDPVGPVVITGELEAVLDAAVAGLGIAVVAADLATEALNDGRLQRILTEFEVIARGQTYSQVILQHPLRSLMSPAVQALVDFLLEHLVDEPPAS